MFTVMIEDMKGKLKTITNVSGFVYYESLGYLTLGNPILIDEKIQLEDIKIISIFKE